jgi:hypothetical protein
MSATKPDTNAATETQRAWHRARFEGDALAQSELQYFGTTRAFTGIKYAFEHVAGDEALPGLYIVKMTTNREVPEYGRKLAHMVGVMKVGDGTFYHFEPNSGLYRCPVGAIASWLAEQALNISKHCKRVTRSRRCRMYIG